MPEATTDRTRSPVRALSSFATLAVRPLALALFVSALLMGAPAPVAEGATTNIIVGDWWFCSAGFQSGVCPTTIAVGDTVSWDFSSTFFPHDSTSCDGDCGAPPFGAEWASGFVPGGGPKFQHTFNSTGVFLYYCSIHPLLMRGEITVTGPVGGVSELSGIDARPAAATDAGNAAFGIAWAMGVAAAGTAALGATLLLGRRRWLR